MSDAEVLTPLLHAVDGLDWAEVRPNSSSREHVGTAHVGYYHKEQPGMEVPSVAIYSIWESRFPPEAANEGLAVTEAIWADMRDYEGYLEHMVLVDEDDSGHLLVVSRWASREHADEVLRKYRPLPNAQAADRLVSEPRRRFLARPSSGNPT